MNASLIKDRQRLQKDMFKTFRKELQILDPELQAILIDDMITAFYNRLNVLKRIKA